MKPKAPLMNISVNQLWHIVPSYFFALKLKFKLSKDWCWTKPQYTLETWLWDAEMVSPKDGRHKPRLGGVALSQQGSGNFRVLNVWFSFVPRVVGGVWHTGVSRTTCLWVNMLHSEPQADTQIFSKRYPTWFQRLPAPGKGSLLSTQAAAGNSKCQFLESLRFSSFYHGSI